MKLQILLVVSLILACNGIKVPVDRSDENIEEEEPTSIPTQGSPIYYVNDDDEHRVDSYLVPPNPHIQEVIIASDKSTPATYLLPPSPGTPQDFYANPTEDEETDWYPIAQNVPSQAPQIIFQNHNKSDSILQDNTRRSKSHESGVVPIPSTILEPPRIDARNEYFVPPSAEELPLQEIQRPLNAPRIVPAEKIQRPLNVLKPIRYEIPIIVANKDISLNHRPKSIEHTLPLHLIPPLPENYKTPTKLYPKKYGGEFKPVPIPIAQYIDESALEIPKAKPAKLFKPLPSSEIDFLTPTDEKINYLYRKAEHQRKLKGEEPRQEEPTEVLPQPIHNKYNQPLSTEQEASESNHGHPDRNVYPAPLRQASPPQRDSASPAPDERTEFRMHGMKGPHSYQFGFDTGKGKNRQFRYEERDNDGKVQGHYGYMDRNGKLRVVNYSADPETGFHAEAPVDKE